MIPWRELRRADVPGGDAPLVLAERAGEYVIRLGAGTLMSSRAHGSEEALAERAADGLAHLGQAGDGFFYHGHSVHSASDTEYGWPSPSDHNAAASASVRSSSQAQ